jgi:hypothetical protein
MQMINENTLSLYVKLNYVWFPAAQVSDSTKCAHMYYS